MKAFTFRLDPAFRWRATQLDLEKSRTAAAAKQLADLCRATAKLGPVSPGAVHANLSAWTELDKAAKRAERELARCYLQLAWIACSSR